MLWIALHLPQLSLEAFEATLTGCTGPVALLDGSAVSCTNAAAEALGVRTGQSRATALALAPDLLTTQADADRNRQALAAVVHAALAFSPTVSVSPWQALAAGGAARPLAGVDAEAAGGPSPPGRNEGDVAAPTVLLEVQATLAYWGGRGEAPERQRLNLLGRLLATLSPLGHRLQVATAPTAAGAAVLAPLARPWVAPEVPTALNASHPQALAQALDAAPVERIGPGRAHWEALQGMGLRRLGDLRALPRSGLARRFGEVLLDALDRAYGDRPDPRPLARLAEHFESAVELAQRAESIEALLQGAAVLLHRLSAWLRAHQARTRRVRLVMLHERGRWAAELDQPGVAGAPRTTLNLALTEPSDDAVHLLALLRERLGRLPLPAPTLDLQVHCDDRVQRPPPSGELFPSASHQAEGFNRLIERLQARLGPDGVQRPVLRNDHRPEKANALEPLGAACRQRPVPVPPRPAGAVVRPVWLLHPPQPLREGPHGLRLGGLSLQLLSGPERMETGWWDNGLVERDYFIAQTEDGYLMWVYRHRRPATALSESTVPKGEGESDWFLHGRFG